jgi:hypothetical protein
MAQTSTNQQQPMTLLVSSIHSRFPSVPLHQRGAGVQQSSSLLSDVMSVVPMERYDASNRLLADDLPPRFGGFLDDVQVRLFVCQLCA